MYFKHINSEKEAAEILALAIEDELKKDKKVLWLLSGGSNISISVETLKILREHCNSLFFISAQLGDGQDQASPNLKNHLAVLLTDERYGPIGHPDSNWQQLIDAGFDLNLVWAEPVLENLSLDETLNNFSHRFKILSTWADTIIGQFGIGADGHIAGILPHSIGVSHQEIACVGKIHKHNQARKPKNFTRLSLSLKTIRGVDLAFAFAFKPFKKGVVESLKNQDLSLDKMPAQILKQISRAYLYSDQI